MSGTLQSTVDNDAGPAAPDRLLVARPPEWGTRTHHPFILTGSSMKKLCLFLAAAFTCSSAHAGQVAGLLDGGYCAPGGGLVLVLSKEKSGDPFSMIGIDGFDCHSPRVTRGRLIARSCYSNGGYAFPMNVDFRVAAGKILHAGNTYTRCTKQ